MKLGRHGEYKSLKLMLFHNLNFHFAVLLPIILTADIKPRTYRFYTKNLL